MIMEKKIKYLIPISTITTTVFLGLLLDTLGFSGYYTGYAVGAFGILCYFYLLDKEND